MQRRGKYSHDIDYGDILAGPAIVAIVIGVIYLLFLLIFGVEMSDLNTANQLQNEHAAIFNELPAETRDQLLPMLKYDIDEGNTIPLKEVNSDYSFGDFALELGLLALATAYLISSGFAMYGYCHEKRHCFFLIDAPRNFLGLIIILLTLPFFPVYLVSGVRMMIWSSRRNREENKAVEEVALEEIRFETEHKPLTGPKASKAKNLYIRYVTRDRVASYNYSRNSLTERINALRGELNRYADAIRIKRRELATAEKELADTHLEGENENVARAEREWEQIRQMRGVYSLGVSKTRGKNISKLTIGVRVRVDYKDELYDFGDYRIEINGTDFNAVRTRSGIRRNATSSYPNYNESGGFCFGSRKYEIANFIKAGRLLEAITLMIDSLHSVNSSADEAEIPQCFRKVKHIESAKLRLKKQRGTSK